MDNRLHGCMKRSRKTKDNFHFLCMQIGKIYCCGKGRWDYCTQKEKEPQYLVFNILVHTKYRGFHSNKKIIRRISYRGQPSCGPSPARCNIVLPLQGRYSEYSSFCHKDDNLTEKGDLFRQSLPHNLIQQYPCGNRSIQAFCLPRHGNFHPRIAERGGILTETACLVANEKGTGIL